MATDGRTEAGGRMTAPVIVCDEYADFWRLIYAITHPETIEGYEEVDPGAVDVDTPKVNEYEAINRD
jgi:hypothetical protein